ncbi:MAG: Hpt domain-containing protein [Candidatus Latescibacterota bacterium]|jgi:HPt (histidine-containing phosphotransfer) domain-containing protein
MNKSPEQNKASEPDQTYPTRATALEWVGGDENLLSEMVAMIIQAGSERLPPVRQAVADADAEALVYVAHAYKGILGLLGENPAFSAARRLEMMGRQGDLAERAEALAELEKAVAHYEQILRSI